MYRLGHRTVDVSVYCIVVEILVKVNYAAVLLTNAACEQSEINLHTYISNLTDVTAVLY